MPTKVGGHVDIIRLAADGAEWLQRKDQCAAQEARPAPQVPVVSENTNGSESSNPGGVLEIRGDQPTRLSLP